MAILIYNLSIFFYSIGIKIAALFNDKAQKFINGRKGIFSKLSSEFSEVKSPVAWFHCASLGEFEQGRPVIEAFKKEFPNYKILLTFFSPSGFEVRKNYEQADHVFYMPLDTKNNAAKFIDTVKPSITFFVKYEFWYHFNNELAKRDIPILSISTIFRPGQFFFKSFGGFYRKILKKITYFFLQDLHSKALLDTINITNCEVSGDTRFDRVWEICSSPIELPLVQQFKNGHDVMVIGSCWPDDLDELTSFINDSKMKFIIAPHEIDEKFMQRIENDMMKNTIRYSKLDLNSNSECGVLIVDNVGLLSSLYQFGEYAYVGGAFGKGLHNILEPATFGIPVFFGNQNYTKFKEAVDLINLGGACAIANYDELRVQFHSFSEPKTYEIACQINQDYVKNSLGASQRIVSYCKEKLN